MSALLVLKYLVPGTMMILKIKPQQKVLHCALKCHFHEDLNTKRQGVLLHDHVLLLVGLSVATGLKTSLERCILLLE